MRRYETILIVRPNANEEMITGIVDKITKTITEGQGSLLKVDKWGLRKLAYTVKKEKQGYYIYIEYCTLPDTLFELERLLSIDENVIKLMTVKLEEHYTPAVEPEAAAQPEEETTLENETAETTLA